MLIFDILQIKENSNNPDDIPSENSNNTDDKISEVSVNSHHISQEGTIRRSSKILQANEILPKSKEEKHSTYYASDIQLDDDGESGNISEHSDSTESEDTPTPDFPFIVLCFDNDKYMKVIHTHEDDAPKLSVQERSSKMNYAKSNMKLLIFDDNDNLNTDVDNDGKSSITSLPDIQEDKVALGNALSLLKKFKTESPDNKETETYNVIDLSKYEPTNIEPVHSPIYSDGSYVFLEQDEQHKTLDNGKMYETESHVKILTDISFNTNIQYDDVLDGIQVNKEVSVKLQDKSKLSGGTNPSGFKISSPEIQYKLDEKRVSVFSVLKGSQFNGQTTKDSNMAITFDYNIEARKSLCQLNDSELNPLLNSVIAYGNNTPSFVTETDTPIKTSESITNIENMEHEYVKKELNQKEGRLTFGKNMTDEPGLGMQLSVDITSTQDFPAKLNMDDQTEEIFIENLNGNLKNDTNKGTGNEIVMTSKNKIEFDLEIKPEHSEHMVSKGIHNNEIDNVEPILETLGAYNEEENDKDFQPLSDFEEVMEDEGKELDENVNEIGLNENIVNEDPDLTSVHSNKELENIEPIDSDQMESKDISNQDSVKIDKDSENISKISNVMETDVKELNLASPTDKDPIKGSLEYEEEAEDVEIEKFINDDEKLTSVHSNKEFDDDTNKQNEEDKNDKDSEHLKDISEVMEADVKEFNLGSQDQMEVFMESKLEPDPIEKEIKIGDKENFSILKVEPEEDSKQQKSDFEASQVTASIDEDEAIRNKHRDQSSIRNSINDTKTISEISMNQRTSMNAKDLTSFVAEGEFGTNDAPIRKSLSSSDSDQNKNEVVSPIRKKSSGGETSTKMKHETSDKLSYSKSKVKCSKLPSFTAGPIKSESKKSTSKTASKVKRKSLTKINEEKKFKDNSRALIYGIRKEGKKIKTEDKLIELKRENRIKLKSTDFYPSINYSPCQNPARVLPSMSNRENTIHFQKILQTDDVIVLKKNTIVNLNDVVDAMAVTVTLKTFGIVNLSDSLLLEEAIGIIKSKCAILKGMINRKYPIFKDDIYQFINTKCMAHPIQPPIYSIPPSTNNQQSPEKLSNHNKEDPGNGSVRTYAYFLSLNKTFSYYTQQQNYIAQEFCDNPHHRYLNGNYLHNSKYLHENATINNRYMNTVKINLDSLKKLFR